MLASLATIMIVLFSRGWRLTRVTGSFLAFVYCLFLMYSIRSAKA